MPLSRIESSQFADLLLKQTPLIDVRSEGEFKKGSMPQAVNLPILNDDERHQVGLCYKQQGAEAAIVLGHDLVCGENKEKKMEAWKNFKKDHPETVIYCFRGGLRSQITQRWLSEVGVDLPLVSGGHKKLREFLLAELKAAAEQFPFLVLSGLTGSGKTFLLDEVKTAWPVVDLEGLANHRGSAFGRFLNPQPAQIDFENALALGLLYLRRKSPSFVVMEDESAVIGQIFLPHDFYLKKKESPLFALQVSIEERALHILRHYVESMWPQFMNLEGEDSFQLFFNFFAESLAKIQKHLGGLMYANTLDDLKQAITWQKSTGQFEHHLPWINKLLKFYYDPLYQRHLDKNKKQIVGQGSKEDFKSFLKSYRPL